MVKLPKLKKKIGSFLTKEEGKINKESLIKTGVLIAAFSIGSAMNAKVVSSEVTCSTDCTDIPNPTDCENCDIQHPAVHSNSLDLSYTSPNALANHNHCVQDCHSNHSSGGGGGGMM